MTFTSLGVTGCTIEGISPNLDKLAKEGLLITRGYNTTALCGPSRNSLFTGMHPMTNGYLGHGPQPPLWWENEFQPNLQLIRMEFLLFNELAIFEFGFVYYGFSFYEGCVFV
ncbi:MAG: sulfatase-like hydrolase/transferase, partial [Bacteroidetes bacterium]|nr:sulfatase-like hydrolase/transferase [Bacteroidota bacterium]